MNLDWLLFGNGHGMASPYFDDCFYWLHDCPHATSPRGRGYFYTWIGGFGAQLRSVQWRKPGPQERRKLFGYTFRPFDVRRRWIGRWRGWSIPLPPRVEISWEVVPGLPNEISEKNSALAKMKLALQNWGHGV